MRGRVSFLGALVILWAVLVTTAGGLTQVLADDTGPTLSALGEDFDLASIGRGDIAVTGVNNTIDLYFPKPRGTIAPQGSDISVSFSHSPIIAPALSTLTVLVNGVTVQSVFLDQSNATAGSFDAPIDGGALLQEQANHVQFRFYLRLGVSCEDSGNPALNARLAASTRLHYAFQSQVETAPDTTLEQLPFPFVDTGTPQALPITATLPAQPSDDTLTALVRTVSFLSQSGGPGKLNLGARAYDGSPAGNNELLVGVPSSLPSVASGLTQLGFQIGGKGLTDPRGIAVGRGEGIVAEYLSADQQNHTLLISGTDAAGMLLAAGALGNANYRDLLRGHWAVLRLAPSAGLHVQGGTPSQMSLSGLGQNDTEFTGGGGHEVSVTFVVPPVDTSGFGYVNLAYNHSSLLDESNSTVLVSINSQDVGTVALDQLSEQVTHQQVRFSGQLLRPGINTLSLRFSLAVRSPCNAPEDVNLWAHLGGDSTIEIPAVATSATSLDLRWLPYPLLDDPAHGNTDIVFPDAVDSRYGSILTAVDSLAGRAVGSALTLAGARASELPHLRGANVVLVGFDPSDSRLAQLAPSIQLRVTPDGLNILGGTDVVVADLGLDGPVGVIEEAPLSGDERHVLLWVAGSNPVMLQVASSVVASRSLSGVAVVVDAKATTRTVLDSPSAKLPSSIQPTLLILLAVLLGAGAMGLLVLISLDDRSEGRR